MNEKLQKVTLLQFKGRVGRTKHDFAITSSSRGYTIKSMSKIRKYSTFSTPDERRACHGIFSDRAAVVYMVVRKIVREPMLVGHMESGNTPDDLGSYITIQVNI